MKIMETFQNASMPEGFFWFNEPARYQVGNGLEIVTKAKTDFWQRTHYGFQRDDGHCLLTRQSGDFALMTRVEFRPHEKYDQCGLMVRGDRENWIKASTEYENESCSRLGSVVTNLGYSDWATQDVFSNYHEICYRISKNGGDFLIEYSFNSEKWNQLRVAHLHKHFEQLEIRVYACSPIGQDFWCRFKQISITPNEWSAATD
jgi:regulation of enolase protein 1 (concanavalin A-like superfamily)